MFIFITYKEYFLVFEPFVCIFMLNQNFFFLFIVFHFNLSAIFGSYKVLNLTCTGQYTGKWKPRHKQIFHMIKVEKCCFFLPLTKIYVVIYNSKLDNSTIILFMQCQHFVKFETTNPQ